MTVSDEMKRTFVEKHAPFPPPLVLETISCEMVEKFLFNTDSLEAYAGLILDGRNFTVYDEWIGICGKNEALYGLQLTLVVLTDRGRIKVDIPPNTPFWNMIMDVSKIQETTIRIPYPEAD